MTLLAGVPSHTGDTTTSRAHFAFACRLPGKEKCYGKGAHRHDHNGCPDARDQRCRRASLRTARRQSIDVTSLNASGKQPSTVASKHELRLRKCCNGCSRRSSRTEGTRRPNCHRRGEQRTTTVRRPRRRTSQQPSTTIRTRFGHGLVEQSHKRSLNFFLSGVGNQVYLLWTE